MAFSGSVQLVSVSFRSSPLATPSSCSPAYMAACPGPAGPAPATASPRRRWARRAAPLSGPPLSAVRRSSPPRGTRSAAQRFRREVPALPAPPGPQHPPRPPAERWGRRAGRRPQGRGTLLRPSPSRERGSKCRGPADVRHPPSLRGSHGFWVDPGQTAMKTRNATENSLTKEKWPFPVHGVTVLSA